MECRKTDQRDPPNIHWLQEEVKVEMYSTKKCREQKNSKWPGHRYAKNVKDSSSVHCLKRCFIAEIILLIVRCAMIFYGAVVSLGDSKETPHAQHWWPIDRTFLLIQKKHNTLCFWSVNSSRSFKRCNNRIPKSKNPLPPPQYEDHFSKLSKSLYLYQMNA